jgi:hypothetical protein
VSEDFVPEQLDGVWSFLKQVRVILTSIQILISARRYRARCFRLKAAFALIHRH